MSDIHPQDAESGPELIRGVLVILLAGAALGIGYNVLQHRGNPTRAVAWVREERKLASLEDVAGIDPATWPDSTPASAGAPPDPDEPRPVVASGGSGSNPKPGATTPAAHADPSPARDPVKPPPAAANDPEPATAPAPAAATPETPPAPRVNLPHIPDTRDPLEVQLATVKKFHDAGAAVVVDARSREEYAEKHIAGASNLPYDDTFKDPSLIQSFQSGGKPVIIYCGGGDCELSKNLAYALIEAGHRKVLVFMGGLPDWEKAGYALTKGATP